MNLRNSTNEIMKEAYEHSVKLVVNTEERSKIHPGTILTNQQHWGEMEIREYSKFIKF
jgi:hypothetical protein